MWGKEQRCRGPIPLQTGKLRRSQHLGSTQEERKVATRLPGARQGPFRLP